MGPRAQRVLVVGATLAACGRVGFDGRAPDAAIVLGSDAPLAMPRLVAMSTGAGSAGGLVLDFASTAPGDLLLVGVGVWDGTPVASIMAGTPLTSAGVRAVQASTSSELWYGSPPAGTTFAQITMNGAPSGYDAWAAVFENVAPGPPAATGSGCLQYPPDVVTAPVQAAAGDLVFGATMLAYPAYADGVAAPFTALPLRDGNGAAYYIAAAPGSYGPSWSVGSGAGMQAMTCASTLAFHAAP